MHEVVRRAGKTVERHLCEQCAKKHGIAVQHMPINELIQKYVLQQHAGPAAAPGQTAPAKACPTCGLPYAEFRQTGLLGCADCYNAFAGPLEALLERAHEGGSRHVGKMPKRLQASSTGRKVTAKADVVGGPADRSERLKVLNRQLEEAVRTEQYERAAAIRDEIQRVAQDTPPPVVPGASARKAPDSAA